MRRSGFLLAVALLASFAAGSRAEPAGSGSPRAGAAAVPLTPARLLGRWGDHGDCARHVIFRGDGTYRSYNGGEGSWRLAGERLTLTGANGSTLLVVHLIDRDHLRISNPNGSTGISQRC